MKTIRYFIIIVLLPLVVSCEEFIERPPLNQISTEEYWKTTNDLRNYVMQYYKELPGHGNFAGMIGEDSNSDNLIGGSGSLKPNKVMNGERTIDTGNWINDWSLIRSVNIFFDNYQKCEDPPDLYKHYLGEAYFFRASFYFHLLNKYGDIPWYSEPMYPDSQEELMRPRDPRTLVVDSILADLDHAILYLDERELAMGANNSINKEAALALKTRVALFEGTWQKYHAGTPFATPGADPDIYFQACVDAAEELMNGEYSVGIYSTGNTDNDYYELFGKSNMGGINEVLLYKAYNYEAAMGNNVQFYTISSTQKLGATWGLISSYLDRSGTPYDYSAVADTAKGNAFLIRIAADCDPRLKSTIWIPGDIQNASQGTYFEFPAIDQAVQNICPTGFQVKKSSNPFEIEGVIPFGGASETGYIIFRYAEVLLNYAEAKYELDGTVAYDQLNLLRSRAGMPDFTINSQGADPNPVDYGYVITDELYEIRRERRVELALEGKRSDDYRRWAAHSLFQGERPKGYPFDATEFPDLNPFLDENGLLDYFVSQLPTGYNYREGQDYLNDIPQQEMVLNPNLTQNPGW